MTGQLLFRIVFGSLAVLIAIWIVALQAIALWVDKKTARAIATSLIAAGVFAGGIGIFCGKYGGNLWTGLIGLPFLLILLFQIARALKSSLRR
jgi:hypothetical protein